MSVTNLLAAGLALVFAAQSSSFDASIQLPDIGSIVTILQQVVSLFSQISTILQPYWSKFLDLLPANTVIWFTLATYASAALLFFTAGKTATKIAAIVLWVIFLITLATSLLHLA